MRRSGIKQHQAGNNERLPAIRWSEYLRSQLMPDIKVVLLSQHAKAMRLP